MYVRDIKLFSNLTNVVKKLETKPRQNVQKCVVFFLNTDAIMFKVIMRFFFTNHLKIGKILN